MGSVFQFLIGFPFRQGFVDFFNDGIHELVFIKPPEDFAISEDNSDPATRSDTDFCHFGFTRTIDFTTHECDINRFFDMGESFFNFVNQRK